MPFKFDMIYFFYFFQPLAMAIKAEGLKPTSTFSHSSFTFLFLFFFFFGFVFVQHTFIVIWTLTTSFATTFLEWRPFSLGDLVFP